MQDIDLQKITELCERLGAEKAQAETMARQLLKRAEQMAEERQIDRLEALDYLLRVTISGRQGVTYPHSPPGNPENPPKSPERSGNP